MKAKLKNHRWLIILNCIFAVVVVAQETHLVDLFPIDDSWKITIKGLILFAIASFNAIKIMLQNVEDAP
jgi:hypothetical protein